MLSVLFNWLYAFLTMYILGRFILKRVYKFLKYDGELTTSVSVVTGIVVTTVYAGYFSLFSKVGLLANIIMILACALFFYIDRREFITEIRKLKSVKAWQVAAFIVIVFAAAFFTMEGQFFWDTGLYHAQTIRWIEEYGVVKGVAHILKRLAYNSTFYCQCALFSFRDLMGQSLHTLSGYYSVVMMLYALFGFKRKESLVGNPISDKMYRGAIALRVFPFAYFIIICSEIVSPASDYPLVNLIILVILRWFQNLINREKSEVPYSLLCVVIAFIISVKLSVGVLVMLVLAPAFWLVKKVKIKDIITYLILGILVSAPYFIREAIISGWLIYPFTGIDLFDFDWKMTAEEVQSDADEMLLWGRGTQGNGNLDDSIFVWFSSWWSYIYTPQQQIIISAAISIVSAMLVGAVRVIKLIVGLVKKAGKAPDLLIKYGFEYVFVEMVIVACLIFWMVKGPGIRYGFGYLIAMTAVTCCDLIAHIDKKPTTWICGLLAAACLLYWVPSMKAYFVWNYECVRYNMDYNCFAMQEDYPVIEYTTTTIDDKLLVYYPVEECTQTWYAAFPCLWANHADHIRMLGDDVKDGFGAK